MCLKIVHVYGCDDENAATAPCSTSRSRPCAFNVVVTVEHEEQCARCENHSAPYSSITGAFATNPVYTHQTLGKQDKLPPITKADLRHPEYDLTISVFADNGKHKEAETTKVAYGAKAKRPLLSDDRDSVSFTWATAVRRKAMEAFLTRLEDRGNESSTREDTLPPATIPKLRVEECNEAGNTVTSQYETLVDEPVLASDAGEQHMDAPQGATSNYGGQSQGYEFTKTLPIAISPATTSQPRHVQSFSNPVTLPEPRRKVPALRNDCWELHKDRITELYNSRIYLKDVIVTMEKEHGFRARWQLSKKPKLDGNGQMSSLVAIRGKESNSKTRKTVYASDSGATDSSELLGSQSLTASKHSSHDETSMYETLHMKQPSLDMGGVWNVPMRSVSNAQKLDPSFISTAQTSQNTAFSSPAPFWRFADLPTTSIRAPLIMKERVGQNHVNTKGTSQTQAKGEYFWPEHHFITSYSEHSLDTWKDHLQQTALPLNPHDLGMLWMDDVTERRRVQNRVAQRNYCKNLKRRLGDLERRAASPAEDNKDAVPDTNDVLDPEVLAYQRPTDSVIVNCVCDNDNDRRFIIPCVTCGKWQHITCYYNLAQDVIEDHKCTACVPVGWTYSSKGLLKRDRDQEIETNDTQSDKRQKTTGAESSVKIKIRSASQLDVMSSLYSISDREPDSELLSFAPPGESLEPNYSQVHDALVNEGDVKADTSDKTTLIETKRTMTKDECGMHMEAHESACSEVRLVADHIAISSSTPLGKMKDERSPSESTTAEMTTTAIKLEDTVKHITHLHQQTAHECEVLEKKSSDVRQLQDQTISGPHYWKVEHLGLARMRFTRTGALQSQRPQLSSITAVLVSPTLTPSTDKIQLDGMATSFRSGEVGNSTSKARSNGGPRKYSLSDDSVDNFGAEEGRVKEHNLEARILPHAHELLQTDWTRVQNLLPESWRWDVEYQSYCWTCTPLEPHTPSSYPLKIAGSPVVLPAQYQWPPMGGMNPPPDPRPSSPIDCRAALSLDVVRDMFLTFDGSIGFYLLISGLLQVIVPKTFDTTWAASHLPHRYGSLKVCYIEQNLEPTMLPPSATETTQPKSTLKSQSSGLSSIFKQSRSSSGSSGAALRLNDFIEARPKGSHRKERCAARIGLKIARAGQPYLVMSTHVITEAILAKSQRTAFFPRSRDRFDKLDDDWNEHVDIWAHNENIGIIDQSFDEEADVYPNGFRHDVTLIRPTTPASVKDMASPVPDLGWLDQNSWNSLRQQTSAVKVLGPTEMHRSAKSIKCSRPSEIMVVGEGVFLNQTSAAGNSKSLKDHDMSTWKSLVSRALLYRVYPDFDPPNGYSGVAFYADGIRQDGTSGPGVVGFQSFVQRSGHVQSFNMEGPALDRRLQLGRVAFYGAFEVPEALKREYTIV